MKIPVGNKTVVQVPGWAVVVTALIIDNVATNIIRLKAWQIVENAKEKEEEIS